MPKSFRKYIRKEEKILKYDEIFQKGCIYPSCNTKLDNSNFKYIIMRAGSYSGKTEIFDTIICPKCKLTLASKKKNYFF